MAALTILLVLIVSNSVASSRKMYFPKLNLNLKDTEREIQEPEAQIKKEQTSTAKTIEVTIENRFLVDVKCLPDHVKIGSICKEIVSITD
ncbi:hypothetical protein GWI33_006353 [Rhynchophorus ferrugineus]|uniref:Uncharacterized protein n=1 Tax=Rhynchophorus ferrugineus TaxID=354439 RepID=A0A834IS23_RHYFE|nr:hypothetical protein GWI33_006353 [Rhynchophorus ferrugineus]